VTRRAWRIAVDAPGYDADDLTGAGAKVSGGRWNEPGLAVVYGFETRALACLETIVHLNAAGLPLNRYLVELTIPDEVWAKAEVATAAGLPVGWDAQPAGRVSIDFGSDWVRSGKSAVLLAPSALVAEEVNVVVNPLHPDSGSITARKVRRWRYDPRLLDRR
jgi:RES domain-containing protein